MHSKMTTWWVVCLLFASTAAEAAPKLISEADSASGWGPSASAVQSPKKSGSGSIRWAVQDASSLRYTPGSAVDMSKHQALRFWLHANHAHAQAGGAFIVYLSSENGSSSGADYYYQVVELNFSGWKQFEFELAFFKTSRQPRGWDQIDYLAFNASGWGNTPDATQVFHVDRLELVELDTSAPKTSDAELFAHLDLTRPGLAAVKSAVDAGNLQSAKTALCSYLRARKTPTWFFDPHKVDPNTGYSQSRADDAVAAKFSIVGHTHTFPGGVIDWSYNPTLHHPVADNHEWTWQLGRMSFWYDLGRAHWGSGDAKYAQAWAAQLESFVTTQRVPNKAANIAGSSWRTIDTGIRASGSWPDAWHRFLTAPAFDDDKMILMLKSFYEHGAYLRQFQTSGNWLTHEYDGLYTVGALFPEFKSAADWRQFSVKGMAALIGEQFLADGGHYELTPGYHQVSIRHIVGLYEVAEVTGRKADLPSDFLQRLRAAYLWPIKIATPNWDNPNINDSWPVDVARVSEDPAKLFPSEPVFAWAASGRASGTPPSFRNLHLPDSGLVILRSGWDAEANYALLDVGPLSRGHSHQDKLNLIIYAHGRRLLFDNGGGNYEQSPYRRYGIDTHSHNTVLVDGLPQRRVKDKTNDPSGWGDPATPPAHYHEGTHHAYALGYYQDAYGDKKERIATHRRELLFLDKEGVFVVVDTLTPNDQREHTYEARWHLLTTKWKEQSGAVTITTDSAEPNVAVVPLKSDALTPHHDSGVSSPEVLGWDLGHSGGRDKALTVRHQRQGKGEQRFVTLLLPLKTGASYPVKSVEDLGAWTYRVSFTDGSSLELTLAGAKPGLKVKVNKADGSSYDVDADPEQHKPADAGVDGPGPLSDGGVTPAEDGASNDGNGNADGAGRAEYDDGGCSIAAGGSSDLAPALLILLLGLAFVRRWRC